MSKFLTPQKLIDVVKILDIYPDNEQFFIDKAKFKEMSRIDQAIAYMLKTACTPYAAAKHIGIDPSALYKAIAVRNNQVKCEHCGSIVRKVKAG